MEVNCDSRTKIEKTEQDKEEDTLSLRFRCFDEKYLYWQHTLLKDEILNDDLDEYKAIL